MLTFQAKTIVGVRNVLRGSGVLRHKEWPAGGPVLRDGVAAVAERVQYIEHQAASLEEALEQLQHALADADLLPAERRDGAALKKDGAEL